MTKKLDPEVFREAAELVLTTETYSCCAFTQIFIDRLFGDSRLRSASPANLRLVCAEKKPYEELFTKLFKPEEATLHKRNVWWSNYSWTMDEEDTHYDLQECRAIALQLTALIVEDEL